MLLDSEYELYYNEILNEINPKWVGPNLLTKEEIKEGVSHVTETKLKELKGEAKIGHEGAPIPREVGETEKKSVYIHEITHGFNLYDRDLKASRNGFARLPMASAIQSANLLAESMENMIFNGNTEHGTPGIYLNAGNTYNITQGSEWDRANSDPFNDIINAISLLEETGNFSPKFMVLSPTAYRKLSKTNIYGINAMKLIEDAGIFPNGREDIYKTPKRLISDKRFIIPPDGGVIGDKGKNIAKRYVQLMPNERVFLKDQPLYTDIYLEAHEQDENRNWYFNILAYQGIDINYPQAFVKLGNLLTKTQEQGETQNV